MLQTVETRRVTGHGHGMPRPIVPRMVPPPARSAIHEKDLLSTAHAWGRMLFTRNIRIAELEDMGKTGVLRPLDSSGKFFRYGLGHEYGSIVVVMKPEFEDKVPAREISASAREWVFKDDFERLGALPITGLGHRLHEAAQDIDFVGSLPTAQNGTPDANVVGKTLLQLVSSCYMGMNPQVKVLQSLPLSLVLKILYPEHLGREINQMASHHPSLSDLLVKVSGTGQSESEFLEGRDEMGRRSRRAQGNFIPQFGADAFRRFEVKYMETVLQAVYRHALQQIGSSLGNAPAAEEAYSFWNGLSFPGEPLCRHSEDWKIFVNPRPEKMLMAMRLVAQEIPHHFPHVGIEWKVPSDPLSFWQDDRPILFRSNTPKIVIYVNSDHLAPVAHVLHQALTAQGIRGWENAEGPSFARPVAESDVLSFICVRNGTTDPFERPPVQKKLKNWRWLVGLPMLAAGSCEGLVQWACTTIPEAERTATPHLIAEMQQVGLVFAGASAIVGLLLACGIVSSKKTTDR